MVLSLSLRACKFKPSRFFAPLLLIVLKLSTLSAQEQLGMRLERYAGGYALSVNPANVAFMPHNWEVSLFSAEVFAENSYAFFHNTSLQNLLRNTDQVVAATDLSPDRPAPANAIVQDFFVPKRKMRGIIHSRVGGPGFAFRFGGTHTVGMSTAIRADFSAYRVPKNLNYPEFSEVRKGQRVSLDPFGFESMAWAEIAAHYSQVRADGDVAIAWGISPKVLLGIAGGYGRSENAFEFTPKGGDTAVVGNPSWRFGLSGNILQAGKDNSNFERNGRGFGVDLGVSFFAPDEDNDYFWRAGVSLLDVGMLRFAQGSEEHRFQYDSLQAIDGANLKADNLQGYIQQLSKEVLGDVNASLLSQKIGIGLPTALSIQAEARVFPHVYLGGLLTQRLPVFKNSLRRASTLAFTPRYEYRWFSVSLPVMINDWQSPRFGLAARLAWLYLGSDNLGSFFTKEKLTGLDAYIGLKINGFSLRFGGDGSGLRKSRGKAPRQKRNKIKCYTF